ncbi:hypothetical protein NBRC10512_004275 [Rhodotorula toruloides]|uniref:RHTO0S04e11584g1_1 n=2 Tax=Rhodotorula toruloides TaxID=5286 RepID=A0A061ARV3_RHOTO|nr:protein of unknown function DUF2015 [Rhodotorula toruloides NP11]EMS18410.1 protein of unknown function DUF2015 [Rhodotorula toruloides NP11]KAJ8293683.1 UPF0357 protein [Rhodotorula toruloides]CDR39889.1 RHTO0S04e11584g1_1 [Rhodotorula toruloides]
MPSYHYSLPLAGLIFLGLFLAWHYRHRYVDRLPRSVSSRLRYYAPLRTFEDAAEQGFSTSNFDLSGNISGDQRAGLDDRTLTEVRRIMERENVGFDEARVIHMNRIFRKNGIDANGFPIDPKAITSLG